jgi:hypothetical protein
LIECAHKSVPFRLESEIPFAGSDLFQSLHYDFSGAVSGDVRQLFVDELLADFLGLRGSIDHQIFLQRH